MNRIPVDLADLTGLMKEDVSAGVLTVRPSYEGDTKKRALLSRERTDCTQSSLSDEETARQRA